MTFSLSGTRMPPVSHLPNLLPRLLSALLLAAALPSALAANPCTDACQALIGEGHALQAQGKFEHAYAKFRAAGEAAPQASLPLSSTAGLLYDLSASAKPAQAEKLRSDARRMANRALELAADDPLAQETLRQLDDDGPSPLHQPGPALDPARRDAEILFTQRKFDEARKQYEAQMQLDPQYSGAWVGAGDCYFAQGDWVRAEALFRRATEIEPHNAQAWRYLSDALVSQRKFAAAEAALLSGIAADPSQRPNWSKLAAMRAAASLPLKPLALQRGARVTQEAGGKYTIEIEERFGKQMDTPDGAMRLMLAAVEASERADNLDKNKDKPHSAYDIELDAWRKALQVADELKANTGKDLGDPALRQMQALARDGQLEPAILILLFRQAYRPALDAWRAQHPGGVKAFIDRYGLQP